MQITLIGAAADHFQPWLPPGSHQVVHFQPPWLEEQARNLEVNPRITSVVMSRSELILVDMALCNREEGLRLGSWIAANLFRDTELIFLCGLSADVKAEIQQKIKEVLLFRDISLRVSLKFGGVADSYYPSAGLEASIKAAQIG